ncbi:hypothetical protein V495_03217 [Pseudogymnoascus sp. VKM F-4514 (FW-929)]|nr:hypothetical protein V495_03217 [Pseudogymnoascus sp. VKM F-4514 (FW-929)]
MADPNIDDPNHNLTTIPLRDEVDVPSRTYTVEPSSSNSPIEHSTSIRDSSADPDDDDDDARLAGISDEAERTRRKLNLKLANPLGNISREKVADMGEQYCREYGLGEAEDIRAFRIGAQIAKDPNKYGDIEGLTEEEKEVLDNEIKHNRAGNG